MDGYSSRRFTATVCELARHEDRTSRAPRSPHWTQTVKSSVLHAMSLAKYVLVYNRGWAADSPSRRVRDKAKQDQSDARAELLAEQMRIKDVRMGLLV